MAKINLAFRILTLSLSLLVIPAFAQQEKPPQSYDNAMEALRQGDYKSAVDHFRQAIAEQPGMFMARYYLGISLYNQENYAEALSAYQELLQQSPYNVMVYYQIAKIHLVTEDYRSAVEEYRRLASRSDRDAEEWAQYLLDLIPREIAAQYQIPPSQIVYSSPSSAPSCLKPMPRPSSPAGSTTRPQPATPSDSTRKPQPAVPGDSVPKPQPTAPGNSNRQPRLTAVIPDGTGLAILGAPPKPTYPRRSADSPVFPMTGNLRPTILYREKAKYTEIARINQTHGTAVLSMVFGEDGTITDIQVVRCMPDGLTQKAITAAQRIRFNPAVKDGTPVSVRGTLEFIFNFY